MDAQTTLADTAAIAALVQSHRPARGRGRGRTSNGRCPQEVLDENRFLAARDGMDAELIEPELGRRVPARELLADLLAVCRPHAEALGCAAELDSGRPASASAPAPSASSSWPRALGSLPRLVAVAGRRFPRRRLSRRRAGGSTNWRDDQIRGELAARRHRGSARSGPRSRRCCGRRAAASPSATISSPGRPAPKTFSFSSIVVKSWPAGCCGRSPRRRRCRRARSRRRRGRSRRGAGGAGRRRSCPRACVSSISSGSIPRSPGKLPERNDSTFSA